MSLSYLKPETPVKGRASKLPMLARAMLGRGGYLGVGMCGIAVLLFAAQPFWEQKDPSKWSPEECQMLLQDSPWAKPANISFFNNSPGGDFGFGGGADAAGLSGRRASSRGGSGKGADRGGVSFEGVVRWGSSQAVRAALKTPAEDDAAQYYILELTGDVPAFAPPGDDDPAAGAQRVAMLRESTVLERKGGDPIYLDRVESVAAGTRFYFPRRDPITASNKEVTFTTKLGPLVIKAKFNLKDMLLRGKLDL